MYTLHGVFPAAKYPAKDGFLLFGGSAVVIQYGDCLGRSLGLLQGVKVGHVVLQFH